MATPFLRPLLLTLLLLPVHAQDAPSSQPKPEPRLEREVDYKAIVPRASGAPSALPLLQDRPTRREAQGPDWAADSPLERPESSALSAHSAKQVHWDSDAEGALWVRGADYKARVHAGGLEFIPFLGSQAERSWPLELSLASMQVAGEPLDLENAKPERRGANETVISHGSVREVFRFSLHSVEQYFEIEHLPARGALELELAIRTDLTTSNDAEGLRFDGPDGGVRYGNLTVLDASGRHLEIATRLEQGRVRLEVPAHFVQAARLPLVLDPLITTLSVATGPVNCSWPQVAYDLGQDVYLVAWEEHFSGVDYDVNSVLVTSTGSLLTSAYIDFSSARWYEATLANNFLAGTFLVAATVNNSDVMGRIRPANGGPVGAQLMLASSSDGYQKTYPAIGGDASAVGPTYFLVVYQRFFAVGDTDIHARLFDGQGSPVGGTILIDNSGGTLDSHPVVSLTNGHPPFATQRWNVMWAHGPQHGSSVDDLFAAQLTWDGLVHTPSFNLTNTPTVFENWWREQLSCSPPLDDPTGDEREWAAFYTVDNWPTAYPGIVKLLRGNLEQDTLDVGSVSSIPALNFYDVEIDSDGLILMLCTAGFGATQAFTLTTTGHALELAEGAVTIHHSPDLTHAVSLAIAQGPNAGGPRGLIVSAEGPQTQNGDIFAALYEAKDHMLGSSVCNSNANSTGYMSFLTAVGSEKVSDNRVTLECENLPLNQVGIAIASKNQANQPLGQGVLCIGSPLYRFTPQITNSGVGGWVAIDINLTALPSGMVVLPGQTWYFQFWHRDGALMNLSNSVGIQFQ